MIALIVRFDSFLAGWERRGEFGGKDYLVPVLTSSHPFADPCLALFALVVVGCVDEVAA